MEADLAHEPEPGGAGSSRVVKEEDPESVPDPRDRMALFAETPDYRLSAAKNEPPCSCAYDLNDV